MCCVAVHGSLRDTISLSKNGSPDSMRPKPPSNISLFGLRVSGLHVEWFEPQTLHHIGDLLGTTHRIDIWTSTQARGQYESLCIEIDLTKPLEAYEQVEGIWYTLQYVGLHLVCLKCGLYGHHQSKCSMRQASSRFPLLPVPESMEYASSSSTTVQVSALHTHEQASQPVEVGDGTRPTLINTWNLVQPRRGRRQQQPPMEMPGLLTKQKDPKLRY